MIQFPTYQGTVSVLPVDGYPDLILFKWATEVNKTDVTPAFEAMMKYLNANPRHVRVIVDVISKPRFPFAETFTGAFFGPFRHRNLAEWLVVGSSAMARTIGNTLSRASGRNNIRWFDTYDHMWLYVAQLYPAQLSK